MSAPRRSAARRLLRDERGAAAVEFAFVVPVLLVLVCAIIDFGRLLYTANSLTGAAREGGRELATVADFTDATRVGAVRTRVMTAFQPLGGTALTSAQVELSTAPDASGNVTVRIVNYQFRPITPMASTIGLGSVTLTRQAVFRWERSS